MFSEHFYARQLCLTKKKTRKTKSHKFYLDICLYEQEGLYEHIWIYQPIDLDSII